MREGVKGKPARLARKEGEVLPRLGVCSNGRQWLPTSRPRATPVLAGTVALLQLHDLRYFHVLTVTPSCYRGLVPQRGHLRASTGWVAISGQVISGMHNVYDVKIRVAAKVGEPSSRQKNRESRCSGNQIS